MAFEGDEIEGDFDWRSVVAHGAVCPLSADSGDAAARDDAVALLPEIDRRVLTHDDPVPERTTLIRIPIDQMTGRRAEMR